MDYDAEHRMLDELCNPDGFAISGGAVKPLRKAPLISAACIDGEWYGVVYPQEKAWDALAAVERMAMSPTWNALGFGLRAAERIADSIVGEME